MHNKGVYFIVEKGVILKGFIQRLAQKAIAHKQVSFQEALKLLSVEHEDLFLLLHAANRIRLNFRTNRVSLCSITNAKSGECPEDCIFCSQSSYYNTSIKTYPLISKDEIVRRAHLAAETKTHRFCIVISGRGIESDVELDNICEAIRQIKQEMPALKMDASLGCLNLRQAKRLKDAGLDRYNHNIETTEEFFASICTTHTFKDRLKTLAILQEVGIEICCGGIFGLGESDRQRIELAFTLKKLDVDCIPINFLNPISGTPLENSPQINPWELLKIIAVYRFILPTKEIRICGGRERNLRSLQSMIFAAGSDAIILGDYLTTAGNPADEDLKMLEDLGLDF
jgi:biotin synthase